MDIAGLTTDMRTYALQSKVGVAVLDKTMENGEVLAAGLVQMIDAAAMELSVNPNIGANFDMYV